MKVSVFVFFLSICQFSMADMVFSAKNEKISFRYPDQWSERKPQLDSTLVLLYADEGSEATCNISSKKHEVLVGLSEDQLDKARMASHEIEFFVGRLKDALNLEIKRYWRGVMGQKDAGMIKMENDLFVGDKKVRFAQFVAATFANGRRFVLICNAPLHGVDSAEKTFNYIRGTMLFSY